MEFLGRPPGEVYAKKRNAYYFFVSFYWHGKESLTFTQINQEAIQND